MRTILMVVFMAALSLSAATPTGPKIRVLLEKEASSAFVEVKGAYRVVRKDSGQFLSSGSTGKRFMAHALQDGLRWGEEYPDVYQISIVPTSAETLVYLDGIQYKGALTIYHVRNNRVMVVNEVPIEDYLKSTLAIEFDTPLHTEAKAVMAIAARTATYAKMLANKSASRPWDVTADAVGYYGHGVTFQKNGADAVVEKTRFMVMKSADGTPLEKLEISPAKAEELANLGLNAKKILQSSYPSNQLGITVDTDEVAVR